MRTRIAVAIFALACLALGVIVLLGFLRHGEPLYITPINVLQAIFGAMLIGLVLTGLFLAGKERWTVFTLVATLLLLYSALTIFSIGLFIAPLALFLLLFSLWKSRHIKAPART